MFQDREKWVEIRRKVLANEASKRAICREYDIHWETLQRILAHPEPPKYEQKEARAKPKIGEFLPIIDEILKSDQQVHRKQRHTVKRIFERLRVEYKYQGGYTGVKEGVRAWRQQDKEVFLPLSHPPGEAQVDFGEADVILRGETTRVALFVMTLPYSDAIFCQVFPRECTEAFLEGHQRAFEFFGGVSRRISYGKRVRFFRVTELITQLMEAREERQLARMRTGLSKLDLLVLDELGYVPASKIGAELLFDVVSTAYERTSLIVTTNLPFENWTEVLGSERLTGATLDRLTHRCHIPPLPHPGDTR